MKTINIQGNEIELTDEHRRRIIQAMVETQEKLNKELAYSEDLQHKDMVEFYTSHIEKLANMLK